MGRGEAVQNLVAERRRKGFYNDLPERVQNYVKRLLDESDEDLLIMHSLQRGRPLTPSQVQILFKRHTDLNTQMLEFNPHAPTGLNTDLMQSFVSAYLDSRLEERGKVFSRSIQGDHLVSQVEYSLYSLQLTKKLLPGMEEKDAQQTINAESVADLAEKEERIADRVNLIESDLNMEVEAAAESVSTDLRQAEERFNVEGVLSLLDAERMRGDEREQQRARAALNDWLEIEAAKHNLSVEVRFQDDNMMLLKGPREDISIITTSLNALCAVVERYS